MYMPSCYAFLVYYNYAKPFYGLSVYSNSAYVKLCYNFASISYLSHNDTHKFDWTHDQWWYEQEKRQRQITARRPVFTGL